MPTVNPRLELFWGAIWLVSLLLGISVAGLTVQALAQELAHADTHLGADADGRRWGTNSLQRTDRAPLEGLAQFYTCRVTDHLGKEAPGAEALLGEARARRRHERLSGWLDRQIEIRY